MTSHKIDNWKRRYIIDNKKIKYEKKLYLFITVIFKQLNPIENVPTTGNNDEAIRWRNE